MRPGKMSKWLLRLGSIVVKVTSAISRARLWFDLAHIYHASKISADGEFFRLDPNPDRR
jgi:hypothetical protein